MSRLPSLRLPGAAVVATVAALLLSGCSTVAADSTTGGFVSGDGAITRVAPDHRRPAPPIAGRDLHGRRVSLADYAGHTVVVNVWASWCGPCRAEAADLVAAARRLRHDGVRFLGIDIRDSTDSARAFVRKAGIPYPSISDPDSSLLLGFRDSLPASAIPTTLVIDRRGRVAGRVLDRVTTTTLVDLVHDIDGSADG